MIYKKRFANENTWNEVTYDEALDTVLGTYKDNAETRSMLTIGNYIPCRFSDIRVFEETEYGLVTSMAGLACLVP